MSAAPELSRKAEMALADLASNGGLLNPEQNTTFIQQLMDQPTLIRECRTVPMNGSSLEITKIGFGSRILRAANQTFGSRALATGDRSAPTFGPKVTLNTKEVIAELLIPYEALEDNIEKGDMENTILALIAERAALDLEELIIQGDVSSGDPYLALLDGVIKKVTSNVVDAAGTSIDAGVFNDVVKALPTKYRRNRSLMRLYVPMDVEQDYRMKLSSRGTSLGDDVLTGNNPVPVFGIPMRGVALMPQTNLVFTNPQNILFGIQRNVRIESERLISDRQIKIVLTARVAVALEDEAAAVKVTNLD